MHHFSFPRLLLHVYVGGRFSLDVQPTKRSKQTLKLLLATASTASGEDNITVVNLVTIWQAVVDITGHTFDLVTDYTAKVKVSVGRMIVAAILLATGEVLSAIIGHDSVGQPILYEPVEDPVNSYPVHLLFQLCRNAVVTQGIWFAL